MRTILILFAFLLGQVALTAQSSNTSIFTHLGKEEGNTIQLELDVPLLLANRRTNDYMPASVTDASGKVFKAEVRARGKFRRKTCDIPPIKIKFSKKQLLAMGLDSLNEVRLTIPCKSNPESEELVLREYVAYRLFERLSPYHVKAKLVRVTIKDKQTGETQKPVYCLLTEHEEETVARLGGEMVEKYNLPAKEVDMNQYALTAVFQYMIGNTDWELATFRNVYQFKTPDGLVRPIPYDFDFSGLVNAPYATPAVTAGVANVQDRSLMADGIPASALRHAVRQIQAAKDELRALCRVNQLNNSTSVELRRYLDAFFEVAEESSELPKRMEYMR